MGPWMIGLFGGVAALYASVGLGGGSSYTALLLASGVPPGSVPPVALSLNLLVAPVALWHFWREDHLRWKLAGGLVLTSVPAAYVGGLLSLPRPVLLAVFVPVLLAAGAAMWFRGRLFRVTRLPGPAVGAVVLLLGAVLGFLAGVTGVGGGIFLLPVVVLLGIGDERAAAGAAALFVTVNSAAGLGGHLHRGNVSAELLLPLAAAVAAGGWIGGRLGAGRAPRRWIRKVVAVLLVGVAALLLW